MVVLGGGAVSYERGTPAPHGLQSGQRLAFHHPVLLRIERDWYLIGEQPAPAPHLAHPEGCASLRIVLVTVPRVSRSCENFPDGFDLHLLPPPLNLQ